MGRWVGMHVEGEAGAPRLLWVEPGGEAARTAHGEELSIRGQLMFARGSLAVRFVAPGGRAFAEHLAAGAGAMCAIAGVKELPASL